MPSSFLFSNIQSNSCESISVEAIISSGNYFSFPVRGRPELVSLIHEYRHLEMDAARE